MSNKIIVPDAIGKKCENCGKDAEIWTLPKNESVKRFWCSFTCRNKKINDV